MPLVTIDFHNTIASCDRWFHLEIAQLASEVYTALLPDGTPRDRRIPEETLIHAYREVRRNVIATGREKDALASVMAAFTALGVEADPLEAGRSIDVLMHAAATDVTPVPGSLEVVRTLHDQGCTLGVVSSAVYPPFLDWTLEAFGIASLFSFVVTSASAGIYKSSPAIYHHALDLAEANAGTAVHIGDSPRWDATTAKEAGMRTVLVASPSADRYRDERDLLPPDLTIDSFVGAGDRIARFVLDPSFPAVEIAR
ncbi:MAG: HAD family hydrolase [Thermomicrobiales bacterium]